MADFCKQCAEEMCFDADFTDLFKAKGLTPGGGLGFPVLCEGCGVAFIIDDEGTCGATDCHNLHGTDHPIRSGSKEWYRRAHELNRKLCSNGEAEAKP